MGHPVQQLLKSSVQVLYIHHLDEVTFGLPDFHDFHDSPAPKKTVWWLLESGLRLALVQTVELDWWNFNQAGLNHGGRPPDPKSSFPHRSRRRRFCRGGSAVKSFEPVWFTVTECVNRLRAVRDHFVNIFVQKKIFRFDLDFKFTFLPWFLQDHSLKWLHFVM